MMQNMSNCNHNFVVMRNYVSNGVYVAFENCTKYQCILCGEVK